MIRPHPNPSPKEGGQQHTMPAYPKTLMKIELLILMKEIKNL